MDQFQNVGLISLVPPRQSAREYPPEEWERRRPEIEDLYMREDLTLEQVMERMANAGFHATKKQFKSRLTKWKLFKNIKGYDALWMARKQLKRKMEDGTDTVFQMNGRPVQPAKLDRTLKRMQVSEDTLISHGSPLASTPSVIDYRTPSEQATSPPGVASPMASTSSVVRSDGKSINPASVFSASSCVPINGTWDDLRRRNAEMEPEESSLNILYSSLLPPTTRGTPFSIFPSNLAIDLDRYLDNVLPVDFLESWPSEALFGSTMTSSQSLGFLEVTADLNDEPELNLDLALVLTARNAPVQICSELIIQRPVLSPWHRKSMTEAATPEDIDLLLKSYMKVIEMTYEQPEAFFLNASCRFWLAVIYASKLGYEGDALRLWQSIDEDYSVYLDRVYNVHVEIIFLMSFEELSRRNTLDELNKAVDQNLASDDIYYATQKPLIMGKAMRFLNAPQQIVREVYRKVIRQCLIRGIYRQRYEVHLPLRSLFRCLGSALMAIGEHQDAKYALNLTATAKTSTLGEMTPLSSAFCDNCMLTSKTGVLVLIEGFRFACTTCSLIDLCETCYAARHQGLDFDNIRHCSADHDFLKIPSSDWNIEESKAVLSDNLTPNMIQWLYGLGLKYFDSHGGEHISATDLGVMKTF